VFTRLTKKFKIWLSDYAISIPVIIALIVTWQIFTVVVNVPHFLIPSPLSIIKELWAWRAELPKHILITIYETLTGFTLAILFGVPLAMVIVLSRFLRQTIYPFIIIVQSTPKIAIAPLLFILLGFGTLPKVVLSFTMCVFPIIINTAAGFNSVQPDLLDLMKSLKASEFQILMKIRFPFAIPYLLSSLKISIVLALMGSVIGEIIGSEAGLGYVMIVSMQYMNTARAFGILFLLSVISIVLFSLISLLEMAVAPWSVDDATMDAQINENSILSS
jgi:NitT/TauT family transport system permease protein